jgi:NAD-dependent deacetylase
MVVLIRIRYSFDSMKQKLVVFTGAGMSAESGIPTFRASDGLWENYKIEEVATPAAWRKNPQMVLDFYNQRREAILKAKPNLGHLALAELEAHFEVCVITQNIDDLHERAGSTQVHHLHGEIRKARSTADDQLVYTLEESRLDWGQRCEKGSQLRPHIVWFGEAVPMMDQVIPLVEQADFFVVVGTSLQVYPAASLIHHTKKGIPLFIIDPAIPNSSDARHWTKIEKGASEGLLLLKKELLG